jgi:hypothetical protein
MFTTLSFWTGAFFQAAAFFLTLKFIDGVSSAEPLIDSQVGQTAGE